MSADLLAVILLFASVGITLYLLSLLSRAVGALEGIEKTVKGIRGDLLRQSDDSALPD